MTDRIDALEARVAELSEALRRVEARLAAVEARPAPARRAPARTAAAGDARAAAQGAATLGSILPLLGRTLLVLAGAFVLRALTDAGTLPAPVGVALGFAYAGTWVALADVAGRRGGAWSAAFHGASAVLIGFPLLYEATARFRLLPPAGASALLAAFTAGALAVAARRRMQGIAWLVALGGIATAVALGVVTNRAVPPVAYLVLLGIATLWLGYVLDWHELRWPVAAAADLGAALVALRSVAPGATEGPALAMAALLLLMALYLGSFAARTLGLGRGVVPFEVAQTAGVTAVGLGGAAFVDARVAVGAGALGAAVAALGLGAYAVAFAFVLRHARRTANFYFYGTIGIVFVLAGSALFLGDPALPLVWGALAIVAAALARRERSRTLAAHAAAYAVAAGLDAGLLSRAAEASFGSPFEAWPPAGWAAVAVVAAMAAAAVLAAGAVERRRWLERVPQVAALAALAWGAAGLAIGWLVPAIAGGPGPAADAGRVAVVRTAVLVAGALVVAWAGRRERYLEAAWLAWPLLVAVGLKILLEDLPRGRPATLFPAFALYGLALILVPRLRPRRPRGEQPARAA